MKPIRIVSLFLLLAACSEDDSCPSTIYLGEYTPTEQSIATIPYQEYSTVVFTDSLDNRMEFAVSAFGYSMLPMTIPGHCPSNYYTPVDYNHKGGMWIVRLENEFGNPDLDVQVFSTQEFTTHKIYDHLTVTLQEDWGGHQALDLPVDKRSLRDTEYQELLNNQGVALEASMEFLGRSFSNVYHVAGLKDGWKYTVYYNFTEGIVAFRDGDGRRWVLEDSN